MLLKFVVFIRSVKNKSVCLSYNHYFLWCYVRLVQRLYIEQYFVKRVYKKFYFFYWKQIKQIKNPILKIEHLFIHYIKHESPWKCIILLPKLNLYLLLHLLKKKKKKMFILKDLWTIWTELLTSRVLLYYLRYITITYFTTNKRSRLKS